MPDKNQRTYIRLFSLLKAYASRHGFNFNPAKISVDFERAAINAVQAEFTSEIKCCLFHYNQAIYRHIQSLHLAGVYNQRDPVEVYDWLRKFMALPMIPSGRVQQIFHHLTEHCPDFQGCLEFSEYMWKTYINPISGLYDISLWNHYSEEQHRTTSGCESFHRKLKRHLLGAHPNIFVIIDILRKQQYVMERTILQVMHGASVGNRRTKTLISEERIQRLIRLYFVGKIPSVSMILRFMNAVSYQLCTC